MKRSPFKVKRPAPWIKPERAPIIHRPLTRAVNAPLCSTEFTSLPKENVMRSEPYRRLVAALPCARCGIAGHSQAAHADQGKGAHIKSDDRTCYPACAARPDGSIGCHALLGATGSYPRDERRALELEYAAGTRQEIRNSGHWPKALPHLEEQEELEPT